MLLTTPHSTRLDITFCNTTLVRSDEMDRCAGEALPVCHDQFPSELGPQTEAHGHAVIIVERNVAPVAGVGDAWPRIDAIGQPNLRAAGQVDLLVLSLGEKQRIGPVIAP